MPLRPARFPRLLCSRELHHQLWRRKVCLLAKMLEAHRFLIQCRARLQTCRWSPLPGKKKSGSHQTTRHVLRRLVVSGWGEIAQLNLVFWSLRATKPSAVAWRLWGRHHQVSRNYSWHPRPWRIIWISWWRLQKIRRHVWTTPPAPVRHKRCSQAGREQRLIKTNWSKQINRLSKVTMAVIHVHCFFLGFSCPKLGCFSAIKSST